MAQLPEAEINKHTQYYYEIIEDMMEDGLSKIDVETTSGILTILAK